MAELTSGAPVRTVDGTELGRLNRFVLHPKTRLVSHIVFERGLLDAKEYVLPLELVNRISEDEIVLHPLPMDIDHIPAFREEHYVLSDETNLGSNPMFTANPGLRMYYAYPPVGFSPFGMVDPMPSGSAFAPGVNNPIPVSGVGGDESGVRVEVEENIPQDSVALKEGARVISRDDQHVGDVERVFVSPKDTRATHLLISSGLLFKEHKLVPIDWVDKIYEEKVFLSMDARFLDRLPDYRNS